MTSESLKAEFSPPAPAAAKSSQKNTPDGCYPRSFHIIDFALHNLFSTAYAIPHRDNLPVISDSAEYLTLEEMDFAAEEVEQSIDPVYILPDPTEDFIFEFNGTRDWAPFTATLVLRDPAGNPVEKQDAHPYMRIALEEFMDDIALAITDMEGIRVNIEKATICANHPLTLYRALRELIAARNEDAEVAMETLKMDETDLNFPIEYRSINLPDDGYDSAAGTNDADGRHNLLIAEGADFMNDDHTQEVALQNIPPRAYSNLTDLYLTAQGTKTRLEYDAPMLRLDEMESIILEETRNRKSYKPNPLLNLH